MECVSLSARLINVLEVKMKNNDDQEQKKLSLCIIV